MKINYTVITVGKTRILTIPERKKIIWFSLRLLGLGWNLKGWKYLLGSPVRPPDTR